MTQTRHTHTHTDRDQRDTNTDKPTHTHTHTDTPSQPASHPPTHPPTPPTPPTHSYTEGQRVPPLCCGDFTFRGTPRAPAASPLSSWRQWPAPGPGPWSLRAHQLQAESPRSRCLYGAPFVFHEPTNKTGICVSKLFDSLGPLLCSTTPGKTYVFWQGSEF